MAGFEESDLYAAFGLDQPAGENDPAPAEPGQAAQTQTTEPQAGGGEQQPAQTQEQEPSQDQGDGEAQGGTDTESDAALLARIRERREKPANGANGWQYRQWALRVAGVGDAKVVELAQGPGTVGVTIVDSNMAPASPEIVEACQALLDAQRPVGATVTAAAPGEVELDVSATVVITGSTTAETVEEAFSARLKEYLAGVIKAKYDTIYYSPEEDTAYTVIYNRILALLLTIDGVENAASLTVNGGTKDVTIQANQVPVAGTVEVIE